MSQAPLMLDSTAISDWLSCREYYRLRHLEQGSGISPKEPSIHQAFGHAVHLSTEAFWNGKSYEEALGLAVDDMAKFPEHLLNPVNAEKWKELGQSLVDIVAVYVDNVEYDESRILLLE